jgi:hypothetical protein
MAARQGHHLVVMFAVPQSPAQLGILLAQGHEAIELMNLVEELLQLRFRHGDEGRERPLLTSVL